MNIHDLIAECTAYDFKVALEVAKPKSWLKSVSAFANLDYMEKRGSGLKKICNETSVLEGYREELKPRFESTASFFKTTISRLSKAIDDRTLTDKNSQNVLKDVLKELTERQRDILTFVRFDVQITIDQLSEKMSVNERTIRRDMAILQEKGLIKRSGGRKEGYWEVLL
ncbi:MAG: DeoR family transcriptional regulator [Bacteroidales bacterium]|nr:DeoR family transcriptional regulator [Bacteroidales bacterium]